MSLPLPNNFTYSKEQLEKAFHLGIIFSNPMFVDDIYSRLNYIQYMGRIHDHFALSSDLEVSFCQNYLILVASLVEALIRGCYSEKLLYCEIQCTKGGTDSCPFARRHIQDRNGNSKDVPVDDLGFKDLLDAASDDGILNGLNVDNLNALRKIRNQVHIDSIKSISYDKSILNTATINSYLKDLKALMKNVYDWMFDHNQRCEL